jgi:Trypsin
MPPLGGVQPLGGLPVRYPLHFNQSMLFLLSTLLIHLASALPQIVGGDQSPAFSYPWLASLQQDGNHICGGTMINPTTLITAVHCSFKNRIKRLSVHLHRHDLSKRDGNQASCDQDCGASDVHSTIIWQRCRTLESGATPRRG